MKPVVAVAYGKRGRQKGEDQHQGRQNQRESPSARGGRGLLGLRRRRLLGQNPFAGREWIKRRGRVSSGGVQRGGAIGYRHEWSLIVLEPEGGHHEACCRC